MMAFGLVVATWLIFNIGLILVQLKATKQNMRPLHGSMLASFVVLVLLTGGLFAVEPLVQNQTDSLQIAAISFIGFSCNAQGLLTAFMLYKAWSMRTSK